MTALDLDRLDRIAAALPAEDASFILWLADRAMLPWQRRAARQTERNRLVRQAAETYSDLMPTHAAKHLATELRRIADCPHSTSNRAPLLREIIRLSRGRAVGWETIHDIISGVVEKT